MRAMVTGATGFVGRRLLRQLEKPVVLSRDAGRAARVLGDVNAFRWDPMADTPPPEAFRGVDVLIHLAGDSVADGRWTKAKMRRIRESRVVGTRHLVSALDGLAARPRVLVCASAVGYYGPRGDEVIDESTPTGDDFLAEVCRAWEHEANRARDFGLRVVTIRTGIVLGRRGGALSKMLLPFKLGLGGRLGDGRQWMPWIHLDDLVNLMLFTAGQEQLEGPLNGVSPHPVTNREFTRLLAAELHRPALFPVPAFALRLALGGFAKVLLGSQRVVPKAAEQAGFTFQHPELAEALGAILHGPDAAD